MKITRAKFKSSTQPVAGFRSGSGYVSVGDPCDSAWGGGAVVSLEYDPSAHALAIRKGSRFERINPNERKTMASFDVALVSWDNVDYACGVDEPKAQPALTSEADVSTGTANAPVPGCSKCGQPSGGKPLCPKCYEAEKQKGQQPKGK